MENNHKLALYVAYYLSKFNVAAYNSLGYNTMDEAHKGIGKILNTNPHTVKNMRDQFDPLHGHRVGWYQAPLSPSRISVLEALQDLSELEIRSIVFDILNKSTVSDPENLSKLISVIDQEEARKGLRDFVPRSPTGKRAEEFFIEILNGNNFYIGGALYDHRDLGVGYDFKILENDTEYFIEIKGISESNGGILLTSKEWEVAKEKGEKYLILIISDLNTNPTIKIIRNLGANLKPKKYIVRTIQVNYMVSQAGIENAISNG